MRPPVQGVIQRFSHSRELTRNCRPLGGVGTGVAFVLAAALSGCIADAPKKQVKSAGNPALVREDACATRMHDISQALLLFFLRNQRLPDTLDELRATSDPSLTWECPVSHVPYVYDRVGFYDMEKHKRVVLFDASPAHLGMRWAVQLTEPADQGKALVTEVVLKPESMFIMRSPR